MIFGNLKCSEKCSENSKEENEKKKSKEIIELQDFDLTTIPGTTVTSADESFTDFITVTESFSEPNKTPALPGLFIFSERSFYYMVYSIN